jgi:hypothetical protein
MGLAPNEQRELTGIENSLRKSDPGLAAMLSAFNEMASRGTRPTRERLSPWHHRLRRLLPIIVATFVLGVAALGFALLSQISQAGSAGNAACGKAVEQVVPCQQARPAPGETGTSGHPRGPAHHAVRGGTRPGNPLP